MASNRRLIGRIDSAGNIAQITKAMEAVAASKMKKAQDVAAAGEAYQALLSKMTKNIRRWLDRRAHPLMMESAAKGSFKKLTIVITSDRGLCGPLNTNLFRLLEKELTGNDKVILLGRKAEAYALRTDWEVVGSVPYLGDYPSYEEVVSASLIAASEFKQGNVSSVLVAYQKFVNTLVQKPVMEKVLPIEHEKDEALERVQPLKYIVEPSSSQLLDELLPYSVHLAVYQAVLSAKAAEQSARMVTMKQASENAEEVKKSLKLIYNRRRQMEVTAEIADVVTASLAVK